MMSMRLRRSYPLAAVLVAVALVIQFQSACASTKVAKARQVSVSVHAALAAVDDAEETLCHADAQGACHSALPEWTTEKHKAFAAVYVKVLESGRALNEGVRTAPVSDSAKADLATVSAGLENVTALIQGVLPPGHAVSIALAAAKDALLRILPIFLE